tara:strand:- start:321 stop:581 length:261 start_codon:yes stop_codon:yes gene_type:complete
MLGLLGLRLERRYKMKDLKELGNLFASLMEQRGYNINDHTPVMNGLGAYYILNLEGMYPELDNEVTKAVNMAYDMAMTKINANKLN